MDEARKRILERRARFVAAAIATFGATSCKERQPQVCLSAVPLEQSDAAPVDAQTGATQSTENTGEPDAVPMPCLAPPPATATPAVCLSPMPPPKTKGS